MYNQYNPLIYQGVTKPFSFSNILNTTQKTLNIVNQALPIVKEVKPIFKNARTLFNVAKGFNSVSNNQNNVVNQEYENNKNAKNSTSGPNFFI